CHDINPLGDVEYDLIGKAVLASVRIDRSAREDLGSASQRRAEAERAWDAERAEQVAAPRPNLAQGPGPAARLRRLRSPPAAWLWLAMQWAELLADVDGDWSPEQQLLAVRLMGRKAVPADLKDDADAALYLRIASAQQRPQAIYLDQFLGDSGFSS